MARFGIVENKSRIVVNVVEWEGAEWLPPRNHLVIRDDKVNIGDLYDEEKKIFIKQNLSKPDPS